MPARWYAQALHESVHNISEKEADTIYARFFDIMKRRGHIRLLPSIARIFLEQAKREERSTGVTLVVAQKEDTQRFMKAAEQFFSKEASGKNGVRVRVDDTIIGGYQLRTSTVLSDNSHKRHLIDMYRRITAH